MLNRSYLHAGRGARMALSAALLLALLLPILRQAASTRAATYTISSASEIISAAQNARAGDVINIRGGVYNMSGTIFMSAVGSSAGWITMQPAPGESVTIDCGTTSGEV